MPHSTRREFLAALAAGSLLPVSTVNDPSTEPAMNPGDSQREKGAYAGPPSEFSPSMIGSYGPWAASLTGEEPGSHSLRGDRFSDAARWRSAAREEVRARMAPPEVPTPEVRIDRTSSRDGLRVEELSWQPAYGPRTRATYLRPTDADEPLPGVLGLHDHGGNKYFGRRKITRIGELHPMMAEHQEEYYGGRAWANQLARRGYAVLVPDAFAFASRRVRPEHVSEEIAGPFDEIEAPDPGASETPEQIEVYNDWASGHESIMAKSLFSGGTTWPGVFWAEDAAALDVLAARDEVDEGRLGCAGLSGGGLRTVYLAGLDERIRCAVCAGMMTTWRDYLLHTCYTHTWMIYIPLLPGKLDYSEILGLGAPRPALVLNNESDPLFTLEEQERADEILREVYEIAGDPDAYRASFYPGGHKFDVSMQEEAFEWFDRWL